MKKMSIRKDDMVVVLSGKDKGKQGKILEVMPQGGQGGRGEDQRGLPPHQAPQAGRPGAAS